MELTLKTDGSRIAKRYLGNFAIQDVDLDVGSEILNYTHRDHIGSLDVVTDSPNGNVDSLYSFSAWGERREVSNWNQPVTNTFALRTVTPRGFTGHEHIDHAGIIHMNGRIYDASLGRFLQADPMVQAPENSQNLNRYSYVLNNPLSYTDPSGYFFKGIGKFFKKYGRAIAAVAITAFAPQVGTQLWVSVLAGAAAGYVSTGSLKGALVGAFSGALFHGIGDYFQSIARDHGLAAANAVAEKGGSLLDQSLAFAENATLNTAERISKVITHGIAGGVMSELNGGKFAHGFASAGFTQSFERVIGKIGGGSQSIGAVSARVAAAAVVGGTASELSGGRFANGAVTGAFSRAFNAAQHRDITPEADLPLLEDIPYLDQFQSLAEAAAVEVDKNCTGTCELPWVRGTLIHKVFANMVRALGEPYYAEVSYSDGVLVGYGTRGSVRADAVFGDPRNPKFVVELKTGLFGYMSRGEARRYLENIPAGTSLYRIKVR